MSVVFGVAPALPLHTAGKYVAGAYIVFLALVLVYVAIMASRLARTERDLAELRRDVELRRQSEAEDPDRQREPVA
jgi:phosphatidylserine synthase